MKKLRNRAKAIFTSAALLLFTSTGFALTSGISVSGVSAEGDGAFTVGWSFSVNNAITVQSLGVWDKGGDGLNTAHAIGIWTAGGTLLDTVTVGSGTSGTLVDGFRYASLSSGLGLATGDYVVGSYNPSGGDPYIATGSFTTPADITYGTGRAASGGSLAFPGSINNTGTASIFGANFQYSVPDSGTTLALLGLALTGLAVVRRRFA